MVLSAIIVSDWGIPVNRKPEMAVQAKIRDKNKNKMNEPKTKISESEVKKGNRGVRLICKWA